MSMNVVPHNRKQPISLKAYPNCYMCGSMWKKYSIPFKDRVRLLLGNRKIVECSGCGLVTCALPWT